MFFFSYVYSPTWKLSNNCTWRSWLIRENILKAARETPNLCVKISHVSRTWKLQVVYVKKPSYLLLEILNWSRYFYTQNSEKRPSLEFHLDWLEFCTFFYCVKKRNPYVKIFKKIYFLPVKIKIHTWKNPKMCPWKFWLPVKSCKIVCVKAIFCTWKNSKKGQKYVSRTIFIFTEKKNTLLVIVCS